VTTENRTYTFEQPLPHYWWVCLRMLLRSAPTKFRLQGNQLRHSPARKTKCGGFLEDMMTHGLIECVYADPAGKIMASLFGLTDAGRLAADTGFYTRTITRPGPGPRKDRTK
jgi:hypothetical protein